MAEGVSCHSQDATVVTDGCVENDDVGWLRVDDATVTRRSGCRFVDVDADGPDTGGCSGGYGGRRWTSTLFTSRDNGVSAGLLAEPTRCKLSIARSIAFII